MSVSAAANNVDNEIEIKSDATADEVKKKRNHFVTFPFAFFVGAICAPFLFAAWYHYNHSETVYIVSGIFGVCLSLYAFNNFRRLLKLRSAIDKYSKLNLVFQAENLSLQHEVDRLSKAKSGLKAVHIRLTDLNEKQKQNLKTFREVEENMKVANLDNIKGINGIRDRADHIYQRWKHVQKQRQRDLLFTVFNRLENSQMGINQQDFDQFVSMIPADYKMRFDRLGTFEKIAGGNEYIDIEDFILCLDVFAEMKVDDVDIDFEIKLMRTTKQRSVIITKRDDAMPCLN